MKKNYEIKKSSIYRDFTEAELGATATGTAFIIDDADFGYLAIIPMKDKRYLNMFLSEESLEKTSVGQVVELSEASILVNTTLVVFDDPDIEDKSEEEIFLNF